MVYGPTLELSPLGSSRYEYDFGWLGTRANGTMPPPPPMNPVEHQGSACFVEPMVASQGAEAVMFIFITGVVLGAVPQYLKLILLASADGISLTSLALMNVSNVTATLNIFILHFEQIKQCVTYQPGFTFNSCQASLLTFYYTLVYTLLWFPLYPLAAHFCSDEKTEHCGMVRSGKQHAQMGLVAHLVPCVVLAAPVIRMVFGEQCFAFENYAMLLGGGGERGSDDDDDDDDDDSSVSSPTILYLFRSSFFFDKMYSLEQLRALTRLQPLPAMYPSVQASNVKRYERDETRARVCCEWRAETTTLPAGAVDAVLEATRYLPQVYASFYSDGSGSLSYLRLLLSIGGGVGATVQKALMKEDISTWFPPLVGHSLEIAIVIINLVNDLRGKKHSRPRTPGGGEAPEGGEDVEGGVNGVSSEKTPLTGGEAAKKQRVAAVNQVMERGEKGKDGGTPGGVGGGDDDGGEGAGDSEFSDDDSDWLEGLPRDKGFCEQGGYVYQKMCTDPKFFKALVKYM